MSDDEVLIETMANENRLLDAVEKLEAKLAASEEERDTAVEYNWGMRAENAALRFSEREWRDKAQDKIAEVERLREALERIADAVIVTDDPGEPKMLALILQQIARAALSDSVPQETNDGDEG